MTSKYHNPGRSYKNSDIGYVTKEEFKQICEKYGNKCVACGRFRELHLDHVRPLAFGGRNDVRNIQPLCKPCNSSKGPRYRDYRPDFSHDIEMEKECDFLYKQSRKVAGLKGKETRAINKDRPALKHASLQIRLKIGR